jgi:protein-tyrosine phosphatase
MAEAVMKKITAGNSNYETASCGLISYHQGETPDSRMIAAAKKRGYLLTHRARKITADDFVNYNLIIGMDNDNILTLKDLCPPHYRNKIHTAADFFSGETGYTSVPDPYYKQEKDFMTVIDLLENACQGIYDFLESKP